MPSSENVAHDVFELPIAVLADDAERILRTHDERRFDRLSDVRDAVRIGASKDADRPVREGQGTFLCDVVVPDHVHGRGRGDERDLVELPSAELAVLDLDDVLPPHRLTGDVHRDRNRRGHGVPDAEDLEDLQGEPRRDVVDHGPVLDRGDAGFPHAPSPRIRSRIAGGISRVGGLTNVRWAPSSASAYASEWTVRPYLRSPTRATFWPSNEPFSSQIVYRSRRVCVGCWPAPSPALMTGFSVNSAARRAAPSCGWRRTIASLYASTMRIVSARVSPFCTEVPSALLNPKARPPSRAIALSNESRVRVDGS